MKIFRPTDRLNAYGVEFKWFLYNIRIGVYKKLDKIPKGQPKTGVRGKQFSFLWFAIAYLHDDDRTHPYT